MAKSSSKNKSSSKKTKKQSRKDSTFLAPNLSQTDVAAYAKEATKVYGSGTTEVRALNSIEISFKKGYFTSIMGPSGSGKSTLMHCMAGLDKLSSGQVFIGDTDITTLSERDLTLLRREHVGFVFQAYNLIPTLTARENITLPLDLSGAKGDVEWIDNVISATGLGNRVKHRPTELSGGQQQRVAVARALASKPQIIFADEPTGNVDSNTGADILTFMKSAVKDMGQSIVMVTHDPVAASYADQVVFLVDGKIVDTLHNPTPETIREHMTDLCA